MDYADGSSQGGFIYAPGPSGDEPHAGESKAGTIEETLSDGTVASRLRAYGSMTYAGFKSYVYADLDRDDPRVRMAYDWIRQNYTLEENPGIGNDGLYYYFMTFSKALDAWGLPTIEVLSAELPNIEMGDVNEEVTPPNASTELSSLNRLVVGSETRDWANDLVDRLAELQNPDGSFRVVDDRWMEDNPVLITSYALLALQHVVN
jgi:squalene-hopene/tetraprenyl-beta-curcumene cyclase